MVYSLAMSHLAPRFGGVVPVEGAPLVGFLKSPSFPVALLDIHGTQDGIIPANASGPIPAQAGVGPGPHGSVVSNDGFFYTTQRTIAQAWAAGPNRCTGPHRFVDTSGFTPPNGSNFTCWAPHGDCAKGALIPSNVYLQVGSGRAQPAAHRYKSLALQPTHGHGGGSAVMTVQ